MNNPIRLTRRLAAVYQQLFATCTVQPQHQAAVVRLTAQLRQQHSRYAQVADKTQVPWAVIAVIHALESSQRFDRHLHNGDPLHSRTVNVPAHRPLTRPPFTWEASAVDALHYSGLGKWRDWSIAGTLFKLEAYNGWGYRRYHPQVLSPYLWSFSQHYQRGKYAADGRFDANLVSKQCGAAVLLKQLDAFALMQPAPATQADAQLAPIIRTPRPYPGQLMQRSQQQHSSVKHIQQRLNALGYQPALKIDNYFGAKTEHAVKWFQANSQLSDTPLKIDGIVGPKTWQALFNAKP
ncbi:peptidoglycan-binding protein [Denitrificimonas caeni]|uniref:Peptidoglycan-binding protein n=1 Tax=Denitrificimonas caeni TaxID=521720 RepID=A0AAF0AII8_9GAMM|nr:peptidoglycan-binding protein [Denitrificimonas caeni]WBE25059.1 peptidoglycan-binding protein [Denitrificimonas caeni]